ncbi:MAG: hypothetical protein AAF828_13385, partial [Bacteroidota bacterium]
MLKKDICDMQHFSTIEAYCRGINISPPQWPLFDLRTFEDNMRTVHPKMPPFKHEFYAIALKIGGGGVVRVGNFNAAADESIVFFNSPYQILSWDIPPDWRGVYVIFSEDFYRENIVPGQQNVQRLTHQFPFLLMDNTVPLPVGDSERAT